MDLGDGICGIRIPDLPGCHGTGANPADALSDAISAAREWAEHQLGNGYILPPPTDPADLIQPEIQANETIVEVPILAGIGQPTEINISIDVVLLMLLDAKAKGSGLSRSAFITSAVCEMIFQKTRS
jgi:predicted RNase H-like HicB family nuclease